METEVLEIEYPIPSEEKIYITSLMREVQGRTFSVHCGGAIIAYTGEAGNGKTTVAKEICKALEAKFDSKNPYAFRGVHFQFGRLNTGQGNEAKRAIRSVYDAVGLNLPEGLYDTKTVEGLAVMLVEYLILNRIQMVFADEAGVISLEAIGGLVTLSDVAKNMKWNLTIVLIGMDDLPIKLRRRQQLYRRVFEWIYFKRYDLEDTIKLLKVMHPHFEQLNETSPEGKKQFKYVHEITKGLPGFMVPFIHRFNYRWQGLKNIQPIDTEFLQLVHMLTIDDMNRSVEASMNNYTGEESDDKKSRRKKAAN